MHRHCAAAAFSTCHRAMRHRRFINCIQCAKTKREKKREKREERREKREREREKCSPTNGFPTFDFQIINRHCWRLSLLKVQPVEPGNQTSTFLSSSSSSSSSSVSFSAFYAQFFLKHLFDCDLIYIYIYINIFGLFSSLSLYLSLTFLYPCPAFGGGRRLVGSDKWNVFI